MKKLIPGLIALQIIAGHKISAQCASYTTISSSNNMFSILRNSQNVIAADKNLNTVVFLHRNNTGVFGGETGNYRYDVSFNGGTTWTANVGVLNPLSSGTASARYPNVAIYNPSANITPTNAFIGYLGATTNSTNGTWNGQVNGVRQLNGAGNTENYNQPAGPGHLIPASLEKGAPGVFWATDAVFNGTIVTALKIYKGTWNGNDISWATNYSVTPAFDLSYNGQPQVGQPHIAFDPSGMKGYMCTITDLIGGPAGYATYPVLYKTIDGGTTWTGPIQVDPMQFNCISANLGGFTSHCMYDIDLSVDINGNPHILTEVMTGAGNYAWYPTMWHHMFDFTSYNGVWTAYDIANVNGTFGTWGVNPNQVQMVAAPQISRTQDGTKIFFSWTDNTTYTLGQVNQSPNLFAKAFDVQTFKWTNIKDFTSCNMSLNGQILFPHCSPEALEPGPNSYKIPFVHALFTVPNDPASVTNYNFLDNILFSASEFTVNQTMAAVTIQQGNNWLLCPNTTASLNISGLFNEVLWSNGATVNATTINTPGTYIATARNGCNIGADTIVVTGMTVNLLPGNTATLCSPNTLSMSVSGNAFSYTWNPGNITNTSVVVSPTTNVIYTVTATGNNCSYPQTVNVTVGTPPTLSVSGINSICAGQSTTLTASGTPSYTWNTGANTFTLAVTPSVNTVYTVTGTSANTCTNSAVYAITVNPVPSLSIVSTSSVLCIGFTATLTVNGANTYTWNNFSNSTTIAISPTVTTSYTANGTGTNNCVSNAVYTQIVSPCTALEELGSNEHLLVYPNPANNIITIELTGKQINDVHITDLTGRMLESFKVDSNVFSVDISHFQSGIYIVSVNDHSTSAGQRIKIIKN